MKKAYILSSCSTCQRILKEVNWQEEIQNIKDKNIEESVIERLAKEHGSYEALFSRRAMKYRSPGLNKLTLTEEDYKNWILKEYTFLKRPVFIINGKSFVGNSRKIVEELKEYLLNEQN